MAANAVGLGIADLFDFVSVSVVLCQMLQECGAVFCELLGG